MLMHPKYIVRIVRRISVIVRSIRFDEATPVQTLVCTMKNDYRCRTYRDRKFTRPVYMDVRKHTARTRGEDRAIKIKYTHELITRECKSCLVRELSSRIRSSSVM